MILNILKSDKLIIDLVIFMDERKEIKLSTKKNYNIFQKIFCLRCFGCMKGDNNSLLTATNRKQVIQKMLVKSEDEPEVFP